MRPRPQPHWLGLVAALFLVGCTGEPASPPTTRHEPAPAARPDVDPHDPSILPRPYTAEQIRDAWVPGLTLLMRRTTPEGETLERWTVVQADAEGAEISSAAIDAEGNVTGEPRVERAQWSRLRDHATFSADRSERKTVTRETPMGVLDGWLYTVRDDVDGSVTELFFAESLPGPPVHMRMVRGGELVMELTQMLHQRPAS